jgi:LmbE family N-acetylglucosaminyl deacetylase
VFAAGPASVDPVTGWEALSGLFEPGADIVGARRAEDRRAAAALGCTPLHLGHWDDQYRHPLYGYEGPAGEELVGAVASDLEGLMGRLDLSIWLVPLGLSHPDHQITAAACLAVADRHPEIDWLVYEELPYAVYESDRVARVSARLEDRGFGLRPADDVERTGPGLTKRQVVDCYTSQVSSLGGGVRDALAAPERVHRLSRRD